MSNRQRAPDLDGLISDMGWSRYEVARRLGCSEQLVRYWITGRTPAPASVLRWLASLVAAIERLPAPENWREKAGQ
jgi:transcriptional regulator with XRE-family HTH domain